MIPGRCCSLLVECAAEFVGTFLFVFLGCGSTAASFFIANAKAHLNDTWVYENASIAAGWGIALGVATVIASPVSGGHLNPAVTMSFAFSGHSSFPKRKLVPYIFAQFAGAMTAGLAILGAYGSAINTFEHVNFINRGDTSEDANSTLTAMVFCSQFPNPTAVQANSMAAGDVSPAGAFLLESVCTLLFVLLVRVTTDETQPIQNSPLQVALTVGCCFASITAALGPVIQVSLNPARDLGPRIVASIAGWSTALPGPQNGVWAYIAGPIVGGLAATIVHDFGLHPARTSEKEKPRRDPHTGIPDADRSVMFGNDKSISFGPGGLMIDPGKGLHHSDFRDSPTPHGHSYRLSSPAAVTHGYLRQHFDLV